MGEIVIAILGLCILIVIVAVTIYLTLGISLCIKSMIKEWREENESNSL